MDLRPLFNDPGPPPRILGSIGVSFSAPALLARPSSPAFFRVLSCFSWSTLFFPIHPRFRDSNTLHPIHDPDSKQAGAEFQGPSGQVAQRQPAVAALGRLGLEHR